MDNEILLSIAIPTYNRYQYLEDCLKATCSINSEKMEIVVQDNSENNAAGIKIIQSINDKRIKYFHTKEHITVSENCSASIEHSSGKYVCLIGDDDTVCDNIIDLVEEMEKYDVDTCVFGINKYFWPDLLQQVPTMNCYVGQERFGGVTYKEPMDILYRALKNGFQTIGEIPRVYHAIASRDTLEKIKEKTGSFFPGPSPDMANGVGCTLSSKKHIEVDIPIMVSGYGGKSTGGMGRKRQHRGSLENKPWLPKNIMEIWDKKIPKLWLGNTIWPASAVTALRAFDRPDLINKLNYGVVYAEVLLHDRSCVRDVFSCHVSCKELCIMMSRAFKRVVKKLFKQGGKKTIIINKAPISLIEAKRIQDEYNHKYQIRDAFRECEEKSMKSKA